MRAHLDVFSSFSKDELEALVSANAPPRTTHSSACGIPSEILANALRTELKDEFLNLELETMGDRPYCPKCYLRFTLSSWSKILSVVLLSEDLVNFKVLLLLDTAFDGSYQESMIAGYLTTVLKLRVHGLFLRREIRVDNSAENGFVTPPAGNEVVSIANTLRLYLNAGKEVMQELANTGSSQRQPPEGTPTNTGHRPGEAHRIQTTQPVVTSYLAETGLVRPGLDGKFCLELGGGAKARPGWLGTDLHAAPNVMELDVRKPFLIDDQSFDYIFSEHMIEHVPFEAGQLMLHECFRVAKLGGVIRIATPSIGFLLRLFSEEKSELEVRYIDWATSKFVANAPRPMPSFVFNNFVRGWGHQFIYDRASLRMALGAAGFDDVKECQIGQSEHDKLRNLENVRRMPDGFLALESMIFEGTRPIK